MVAMAARQAVAMAAMSGVEARPEAMAAAGGDPQAQPEARVEEALSTGRKVAPGVGLGAAQAVVALRAVVLAVVTGSRAQAGKCR